MSLIVLAFMSLQTVILHEPSYCCITLAYLMRSYTSVTSAVLHELT